METKQIIAFMLLFTALLVGTTITCISRRARDLAFLAMMSLGVVSDRLDVNFLSRYWYRGSTRGIEVSFVDVIALSVLVSSFLFPLRGHSRWRWPAGLGLILLFFLYSAGSTLISDPQLYGVFELSKMIRGIIFFLAAAMFVRTERELQLAILALCCAGCLEGLLAIKQRAFTGVDRVSGTLDHANSLSMYLCMIAPVFVAAINAPVQRYLRWLSAAALTLAACTIVLTVSRAGVPIFALVILGTTLMCMSWRFTFKKVATIVIVAVGLAVGGYKFSDDLEKRYTESSLSEEYLDDRIIDSRGYYLRLANLIMDDHFLGVGLNNWSYAVSKTYGFQLHTPYSNYDDIPPDLDDDEELNMHFAAPAHNLAALTVGELGVPGLIIFSLMWLRWFQMGGTFLIRRLRTPLHLLGIGIFFAMLGVFLQSLTEWVFRQTAIYLTFHSLMGVLASLYMARRKERRARQGAAEAEVREPELQLVEAN